MESEHLAAPAGTRASRTPVRQRPQRAGQVRKDENGEAQMTVHDATFDLLRRLELTTVFGNPGSTEQPFLKNFPQMTSSRGCFSRSQACHFGYASTFVR